MINYVSEFCWDKEVVFIIKMNIPLFIFPCHLNVFRISPRAKYNSILYSFFFMEDIFNINIWIYVLINNLFKARCLYCVDQVLSVVIKIIILLTNFPFGS